MPNIHYTVSFLRIQDNLQSFKINKIAAFLYIYRNTRYSFLFRFILFRILLKQRGCWFWDNEEHYFCSIYNLSSFLLLYSWVKYTRLFHDQSEIFINIHSSRARKYPLCKKLEKSIIYCSWSFGIRYSFWLDFALAYRVEKMLTTLKHSHLVRNKAVHFLLNISKTYEISHLMIPSEDICKCLKRILYLKLNKKSLKYIY